MVLTRSMYASLKQRQKAYGYGAKRALSAGAAMAAEQFARTAAKSIGKNVAQATVRGLKRKISSYRKGKAVKKKRVTKFEKKVRNVVRKELLKDGSVGTYRKNYSGCSLIPSSGNHGANRISTDMFRNTAPGVFTAVKTLDFFTPLQFIDAASVLYNNKAGSLNPDTFLTNNFNDPNLKFYVKSAYIKVEFKNVGVIQLDMKVYEAQAKDLENDTFYNDWVDAMSSTNLEQPPGLSAASIITYGVEPTQIIPLLARYSIKTHRKVLEPGQSLTVVLRTGPFHFERGKIMDGTAIQKFAKYSKQLVYSFNALPTLHYDQTADLQVAGRALGNNDLILSTTSPRGILIDVAEKWVVQAPEEANVLNVGDRFGWFSDQDVLGKTLAETSEITKDYQRQTATNATTFSTTA